MNTSTFTRLSCALALALSCAATQAASVSTTFAAITEGEGTALLLNGHGKRVRAIFRVYDMALYTTRRVGTAAELMALPGPKKLQFEALRELSGTDLGLLFIKGIQANSPREQVQRHALSTTRLIEIFSGKAKLVPPDTFTMEFIPGKGTQFYITGAPQGGPVGDAEFFEMILRIWFGPNPVDTQLRDALLGKDN